MTDQVQLKAALEELTAAWKAQGHAVGDIYHALVAHTQKLNNEVVASAGNASVPGATATVGTASVSTTDPVTTPINPTTIA